MKKLKLHVSMSRAELRKAIEEHRFYRICLLNDTSLTVWQKFSRYALHIILVVDVVLIMIFQMFSSRNINTKNKKPQLQKLSLFADNLPISWGKIVKASAADYEDRINELWGAGKYRSAKWNQKLAWLCALSNLGHYLWLKAWKPVSTVFRRLL